MPILDADLAKHQQEEKAGLDSVYVSQEEQLRQSIAADIQDAYEMVGIAKERLAVAKLAAESTDLQLEVVRTQNQYGTATTQDLLTAAVNAANASNTLATASSGYQLAVLQLQYVMGY
jgi:outer membrane protein TolC